MKNKTNSAWTFAACGACHGFHGEPSRPAELSQECLFSGEITQVASDSPIQIRFTRINHGRTHAACKSAGGSRSRVQFKAASEINLLPEGSEVLYRYQELVDGGTSWELVSVKTPSDSIFLTNHLKNPLKAGFFSSQILPPTRAGFRTAPGSIRVALSHSPCNKTGQRQQTLPTDHLSNSQHTSINGLLKPWSGQLPQMILHHYWQAGLSGAY